MDTESHTILAGLLAMPDKAWSLGSFGAIAEFMRDPDETCDFECGGPLSIVTSRGGIRIVLPEKASLIGYDTPSRLPERRGKGLAVCLPAEAATLGRRTTITELGADEDALRPAERDHRLFDIGLGQLQVDALVRTADPETISNLRAAVGRSLFDPDVTLMREIPRLSPHRVFVTRCGRIEVYQPVPPVDGRSPDGPHTHVLPRLLRSKRTHAANIPIPDGLVPCLTAHLSPPAADHAKSLEEDGE